MATLVMIRYYKSTQVNMYAFALHLHVGPLTATQFSKIKLISSIIFQHTIHVGPGFLLIAGNRLFFPAVKPKVAGCWFWKKKKKKKKKKKALVERKGKHPTFVLASYGAECYRNSFRNVKANTRHLF